VTIAETGTAKGREPEMPKTICVYWKPRHGRERITFNWPAIRGNSVVLVTACEYTPAEGPQFPDMDHERMVGAANVWVSNIAPHEGGAAGVTFVVNVDSDHPIPIATDITVLDEFPIDVENE
jgi:hypothetical protein